jgi:hypothetical protein
MHKNYRIRRKKNQKMIKNHNPNTFFLHIRDIFIFYIIQRFFFLKSLKKNP